ncbi:MarR family transcriptional regulator [Mycolicibacterium sp. P9-64]|uniref:MarR family winged helix-turn-helix transcriptional regulator n=1 Tax=Mycolicibacterium sp. P9-64 TaxID=2024612 RepID=UPI0011EC4C06|nr:MarR family transcriptional regulator [Mycolicibacterium sp. P9-64]KAA0082443.1 MarR family transcriptional regulator [Mycolicibacterium sp. P9-64]
MEDTCTEFPPSHPPAVDETEQRSWQHFLDAAMRLYILLNRKLMDGHKLTLFDVLLLEMLAESSSGSARMGDLANALMLTPSRVSQQIRRLESQGLVHRTTSSSDRRGVVATITHDGLARFRPALVTYSQLVRTHYLDHLSRPQMAALGDSSRRINNGMNRVEPLTSSTRNRSSNRSPNGAPKR